MNDLDYINEHRAALDLSLFTALSEDEIIEQLALIEKHAPFGEDPWRFTPPIVGY
jgi:hypothetical protein